MPAEEQTTPTTAASASARLPPQGSGPLPFHLGVTVTQHQLPSSVQCWSGKGGAGSHGWKERGVDVAEGQLETLHKNHGDKRREKRWREGEHGEVTFGAPGLKP